MRNKFDMQLELIKRTAYQYGRVVRSCDQKGHRGYSGR